MLNVTLGEPTLISQAATTGLRVLDVSAPIAVEISYTGNGTVRGVEFTEIGTLNAIERHDGSIHAQGQGIITTADGEMATHTFHSVGQHGADGLLKDNGVIFLIINQVMGF